MIGQDVCYVALYKVDGQMKIQAKTRFSRGIGEEGRRDG